MKNNQQEKMTIKTLLIPLALFGFAALPLLACAEGIDASVTVGVAQANLESPSAKFGEYSGLSDDESWLMLDFALRYQPGTTYLGAEGASLGLDNRRLGLEWGKYGVYGLNLNYSEIPHLFAEAAKTPFADALDNSLELPAAFVPGATTAAMTTLAADARTVEIGTERITNQLSFFLTPDEHWRADVGIERYDVEGHTPLGTANFFFNSTQLPVMVDQTMEALQGALGYANEVAQWEVRYRHSAFTNDVPDVTWDNPFSQNFTEGRIDLAPDNEQQTLTLMGAVNLPKSARLTLTAERSRLTQDDALLPYSNNSASTITTALPRASADARIDVSHVNLDFTARPTKKLKLNTRYRYRKTDNQTTQDLFLRVRTDRNEAQAASNAEEAAYNLPHDTAEQQFKIDANYTFGAGSNIRLAAQRDIEAMNYRAVEKTKETTFSGGLTKRFTSLAQLNVDLSRAHRSAASGYDQARVFNQYHTSDFINDPANNGSGTPQFFDSNPNLRQFDIADRNREEISFGLQLYPAPDLVVGMRLHKLSDDYLGGAGLLGLRENKNDSATFDVDYAPAQGYSLFGYLTQERATYVLAGRQFGARGDSVIGYDDSTRDWTLDNDDDILTLGVGGSYRLLRDRLLAKVKYQYSEASTDVQFAVASALGAPEDLPTTTTKLSRLEFSGEYALRARLDLGVGIIWERFRAYDPMVHATAAEPAVAAASTAVDSVLSLIGPEEGYAAYTAYTTLTYRW